MTEVPRILALLAGLLLFGCATTELHAQTRERSARFQWRVDSELVVPLRGLELTLESELDLESSLDLAEWQVGRDLGFPLGQHLSGAVGFRAEIESEEFEHGPQGSLSARLPSIFGLSPSVRNRLTFGRGDLLHRYRGRLRMQREGEWRGRRVGLDLHNEAWYDFGREAWIRNRFSAAGSRAFREGMWMQVGYHWERRRDAATIHRMMLGFYLAL